MSDEAPLDHRQLLAEIDAEVRRRRDDGDYPEGFERELDLLFDKFAPPSVSDDFDAVLERADQHAFIDADAPVESRLPGGGLVKRLLRKLMAFYVQYVARNVTAFASTIVRAVRLLGRRVDRLEEAVPGADPRVAQAVSLLPPVDVSGWTPAVVQFLSAVPGRVAVAECGDGALVRALTASGVDAYGVEPDQALVDEAVAGGLEVRLDDARTHLKAVPEGALGGIVLVGCVERLAPGARLELAALAANRLRAGGRVIVVSGAPQAWSTGVGVVVADLSPARPWHPETWQHLWQERGLVVETRAEALAGALEAVPGDDPSTKTLNANLDRLNDILFAPASYLVTGVRAGTA